MRTWPTDRIGFGGDYNPEQWPREVWPDDMRLMREAGVSFVTLGVFSWSALLAQVTAAAGLLPPAGALLVREARA